MVTVPHHIIAIGASAGGMEEINLFFDHTPLDGVAYVVIQHLSSDFKSRMVELLDRHSKLVVIEAKDGTIVKCNEVYLIPSDKFMTMRGDALYLADKEKTSTPNLTINRFFLSLAANIGNRAIGIILSGLGSDGTEGIKAIKKAGGMVIARNPETTKFGSMPSNAIATGLVDFILEPELMPNAIEDYITYGGDLMSDNNNDEKNITAIVGLLKERSPLDFSDYKRSTLLRRTKRRAAQNNFITLESYLEFLKITPAEIESLTKDFLISVTAFFRDQEAFDFIQNEVIPEIVQKLEPGEELKMWVAGCATGEEVYSLAILATEHMANGAKDTAIKIFATDIDSQALVHAGKGVYAAASVKKISPERIEKYFTKEGDFYKIKQALRKMVIFAQHDLVKNPPYCNMHFISCRNLLIYMTPLLQKKIFAMLLFGLKQNGYLFLGSSENPAPIIKKLEVVNSKWKIYKNLETKRTLHFDAFSVPEMTDLKRHPFQEYREDSAKNLTSTLSEAITAALITEQNSLVICVDENNHVIKSYGDTTKYLHQKNFNSNLIELLPKPLAVTYNTASTACLKTNEKVTISGIRIKSGQSFIVVSLSVAPLIVKKGDQRISLVTIQEDKKDTPQTETPPFNEQMYFDQYTVNLEEELKELKSKLHVAYEQLDASNENMQSFNEELLSANEEMQSSNEEMQSVNEELDTINSNYQQKNKELTEMNDDLNNYFRSNINGQLFINNELLLMRFSPGTVKQINLLETDIGRPITNISTNIKFETMADDIRRVLAEGIVISKEIETNNGKWYQIMTMPYVQQADHKSNGAIITFNDITELKNTQLELDKKNKSLRRINEDLDNFVHVASHDLLAPLNSIKGSIGVLNKIRTGDPEQEEFLNIINASILKFQTLIKDISKVAIVEHDNIATEMVDMAEILNNIEWSLEDKIKLLQVTIIRDLEVSHILFSKKNLRSIVFNLISNGIKYRGDVAPVITVRTSLEGDDVILSVEDNGMGMPNESIHKIFDIYGRLNQQTEGQGIGLYLAHKIVNAANGNIAVESELGKGSKFSIHLKSEPALEVQR